MAFVGGGRMTEKSSAVAEMAAQSCVCCVCNTTHDRTKPLLVTNTDVYMCMLNSA